MIVSIHIPKTAGTAIGKIFDDISLRKIMYDYGGERDMVTARECPDLIRQNSDFIRTYFEYLHGHFHYLKYADVFPDCQFISGVRHPVSRVISQYMHISRSGDPKNERHKLIMDGEMDIVHFSKFDFVGNAQWYYLEGRDIKDYDFIFVQEYLDYSLEKYCEKFNRADISDYLSWFGEVPKVNKKPEKQHTGKAIPVEKHHKEEIYRNCERDIELYLKSKELLGLK